MRRPEIYLIPECKQSFFRCKYCSSQATHSVHHEKDAIDYVCTEHIPIKWEKAGPEMFDTLKICEGILEDRADYDDEEEDSVLLIIRAAIAEAEECSGIKH